MQDVLTPRFVQDMVYKLYPEVENDRDDDHRFEHPMTAAGVVLLTAALLETIDPRRLREFTGYPSEFISAIHSNMLNNHLWVEGRYGMSWLSVGGIDAEQFWEHIELACGDLSNESANEYLRIDACLLYWAHARRYRRTGRRFHRGSYE